ncbi:MAG: symmetrical bis(5'-nucleosyl)-tetraphosphatase [Spirochaetales bacterium]
MNRRRFVIGDVHGQYPAFERLLEYVDFSPDSDHLYCVGDLVNKGADSIRVLRLIRWLGDSVTTVLGNHELMLMRAAITGDFSGISGDLRALLQRSEGEEILSWLRRLPLMELNAARSIVIVHAGLAPQWDVRQAYAEAQHVQSILVGERYEEFVCSHAWTGANGGQTVLPDAGGDEFARARYALAVFTHARKMTSEGALPLGGARAGYRSAVPWFELEPWRSQSEYTVFFGHWASLEGYRSSHIIGLDTACAKGGTLSLYEMDSGETVHAACPDPAFRNISL